MYERKAPRLEPVLSEMRKNDLSGIISVCNLGGIISVCNLSGTLIYRTI